MSRRILSTSLLAASALAVATTGPGAAAPPVSHDRATGHTLAFTAKHTGIVPTGRRDYVLTDDIVQHGQQVGADVLSCRTRGTLAHCTVSLALGDGQMHLRITLHESGDLRGKVTGGDGRYAGAVGRVRGHAASEKAERVVVRWHS
ncbi:MAG TPA: hypothetical protein VFT70_09645 [Nocardioides sp.]|nr:hypothetical protein [Nocardioides sp.]